MKIAAAHAFLQKLPLTKPYTIAYKTITDTEIVFVEMVLENGMRGLGASNPFEEVVGETPADTLHNLQSGYLDSLIGRDIRHFQQLIDDTRAFFPKLPGTQAAIDIALYDLFGRFLNIPVLDFLGRKISALPTSVTIGIKPSQEMLEEAKGYQVLGFTCLKVKTGLDVEQDIERVCLLRDSLGAGMALRVDANQGYALPDLQRFLQASKNLGIELIEQPLPAGLDQQLQELAPSARRMLCADESLHGAASAQALACPPQPYGIFNIKLMKAGGIRSAKEIGVLAENAGIDLFWGCNDESIVSITAALHAAYSCANTRYLDLDGSFDISKDLVTGGFTLENGCLLPNGKAGLGLALDA